MIQIEVEPSVVERLHAVAERRQISVQALLSELVDNLEWKEWHREIDEEHERFLQQHSQLLETYKGEYIAMRHGKVLDHDPDLVTLHNRVRAEYDDVSILITLVADEPIQTFRIRRPRRLQAIT